MAETLFILAALGCLAVLAVLMLGVGSFAKGGKFHGKYSNKLMRLRVGLQAIAVILIILVVYFGKSGGG